MLNEVNDIRSPYLLPGNLETELSPSSDTDKHLRQIANLVIDLFLASRAGRLSNGKGWVN